MGTSNPDDSGPAAAPAVASAFLQRYLEDVERGGPRSLSEYQALFPGYEGVIAREHERLCSASTTPGASPDRARNGPAIPGHPGRIGPYRILEVVGQGGMGIVYVAEQAQPIRRRVALKLIKLGMDTREVLARFESERQALALMSHPHIARVFDAGSTPEGRPYFVMEHVAGIPITRFCDLHELTTPRRLELFLQVCDAVQHAHQKGIIHRDLKPSNVLVAFEDGKAAAKIIDFGVAKSMDHRLTELTVHTEQGQIIGTPEYMSPEQAEMNALDIDTRTDIYSLGVLLYEVLAGRLPFEPQELRHGGYAEIQRRIREDDPPPPSTRVSRLGPDSASIAQKRRRDAKGLVRELRGEIDWIVLKAMAKDRSRRYSSASEVAADIRRHLAHEAILAGPPGAAYRLRKLVRKHRAPLLAAAVILLGLAAGLWAMRARAAAGLYSAGLGHASALHALKQDIGRLEREWQDSRDRHGTWQPVWERDDELDAWRRLESARRESDLEYERAVAALQGAREAAPVFMDRARIGKDLEDLYFDRHAEALRSGAVSFGPDFFQSMILALDLDTDRRAFERGSAHVASEPAGVSVYCFRYEEHEARLLPIAFDPAAGRDDPAAGLRGGPYLEVAWVDPARAACFEPGDRILQVNGLEVTARGAFVRACRAPPQGEALRITVRRHGREETLSWLPPEKAGAEERSSHARLRDALGIDFAGYPLDFTAAGPAGVTREGEKLSLDLPRGSYLLVLRKEGFVDARVPFASPPERGVELERVRLARAGEVPPGFVLVPAGPVCPGGDSKVDQALDGSPVQVKAFFIARREVTVGEYLAFVNDPEVLPRTKEDTGLEGGKGKKPSLLPHDRSGFLFEPGPDGRWKRAARLHSDDWPILALDAAARTEYADWMTRRSGGRWRFRLPTDLEWEKAARGVDRRAHVWGNYLVWCFCRSNFGVPGAPKPCEVGSYPEDESLYGVEDMAGSVLEPTSGDTIPGFASLRGGSWREATHYYYRIANREGRHTAWGDDLGLRLAADAP